MKLTKLSAMAIVALASLSSCGTGENEFSGSATIGFETVFCTLAGPTSYGANLYSNYDGQRFERGQIYVAPGVVLNFGINEQGGEYNFSSGGVALSTWNYRTDAEGTDAGWWKTYENQCSVYNTESTSGKNMWAGADGSNVFAVITGYDSPDGWQSAPELYFSGGVEVSFKSIMVCPTSYLYGVVTEGNPFGNNPGQSLEQAQGWLRVDVYGYDGKGAAVNGSEPLQFYVCDYRAGSATAKPIASTWTKWDLSALGPVNKVKFNFVGSDTGAYGLNTPAYLCIDNLNVSYSF